MAILEQGTSQISGGFDKGIEEAGRDVMLDIFQKNQYQYPVKSTIREIVSNCVDSINEREVAKKILSGASVVSDFFEDREGDVYKDSKFVPEYYDPNWLSNDPTTYITYYEGATAERDSICIKDYGVGLGGRRLEKYFSLFFSTKRLSKLPLGKFGLGNKAPLSLEMGYYTVESRYNGQLYRFNVYKGKVESIIPKFNIKTGQENTAHEMPTPSGVPYIYYSEVTTEKNGVSVIVEAKKPHKELYRDAVQSQLLYFDNINFQIIKEGYVDQVDYKADIIYEDEYLVMSSNSYYSKPHLLLNRVNYGYINFGELEIQDKIGNIGIKVLPEDVEISPSRESLVWNDKTKETILSRFKAAVQSATVLVQEELKEKDFLRWVKLCYGMQNRYSSDKANGSVVERLSCIIDMASLEPTYNGTDIKFNHNVLDFLFVEKVEIIKTKKANKVSNKVDKKRVYTLYDAMNSKVVISTGKRNNRKDKYLLSTADKFVRVKPPYWLTEESQSLSREELLETILEGYVSESHKAEIRKKFNANNSVEVWNLLKSSIDVLDYEAIEVPDSFVASNNEEDEEIIETEEEKQEAAMSNEERRKLHNKVVIHTPRFVSDYRASQFIEWQKLEVTVKEIEAWDAAEVYYGNDVDGDTIKLVAMLSRKVNDEKDCVWLPKGATIEGDTRPGEEHYHSEWRKSKFDESITASVAYRCSHFFDNTQIKLIKVSQQTTKLYKNFYHINKFFYRLNRGVLTMSNVLIQWNTSRLIKQDLHKLNFLWNYPFSQEKKDQFREIVKYVKLNYRPMAGFQDKGVAPDALNNLTAHLDKVLQFQLFVKEGHASEDIAKLASEMWGSESVVDGQAIDMVVWDRFKALLEWSEPIRVLLNEMTALTGIDGVALTEVDQYQGREECLIKEELEHSLISYIKSKNVS